MEQALSSILAKLHFLKVDLTSTNSHNLSDSQTLKYCLKNHFDSSVIGINGTKDTNKIHLEAKDARIMDQTDPSHLFSLTIKKPTDSDIYYKHCELFSTTDYPLGFIVMKDMELSTCTYNFDVLDNSSHLLFQICSKQICVDVEQKELQIKNATGNIVARINIHNKKLFLSMTPELDCTAKIRFISACLMLLVNMTIDGVAKNQTNSRSELESTSSIQASKPHHARHALAV